ncbi:glyoxylate-induced protein [Paenibacillus sambharensis]|uniref:Glyoxylate-induced protein n=1 Tax=Paenibacillus sambharensis TaxID=1803190 RepID=A0A2W1LTL1_9BACL|nr:TIM barrel protein [Paenibacillus sambharensis]PZD94787.1 glyoxylate-induced protein [Paenibacillus sambharensis]
MKLSYNTETLFQGMSIYEAMETLAANGLKTIEFWSWEDKDLNRIRQLMADYDMNVASIVVKLESLVDPARREATVDAVKRSAEAANQLGCSTMVHTVGFEAGHLSREEMRKSLVEGLYACIPALEEAGITTAIEPLNTKVDLELSGYYLTTSEEALDIVKEINHPLVKVCYDIYHVQVMEGHVISRMQNNIHHIAHIQAAGHPGRHELYLGELNYDNIFDAIKQMDYNGYVGIEYFPIHDPIDDLKRIHAKHHTG